VAELPVTGTQPNSKYVNASGVKDGHVPPDTVAGGRLLSVACGSQPAVVPQVKRAPGSEMDSPHNLFPVTSSSERGLVTRALASYTHASLDRTEGASQGIKTCQPEETTQKATTVLSLY